MFGFFFPCFFYMITQLLKFKLCIFPISTSIFFQPDSKQNANTPALTIISFLLDNDAIDSDKLQGHATPSWNLNHIIVSSDGTGQLGLMWLRKRWEWLNEIEFYLKVSNPITVAGHCVTTGGQVSLTNKIFVINIKFYMKKWRKKSHLHA